jgi:hypothetical protein
MDIQELRLQKRSLLKLLDRYESIIETYIAGRFRTAEVMDIVASYTVYESALKWILFRLGEISEISPVGKSIR